MEKSITPLLNRILLSFSGLQSVLHDEAELALVAVGIPVRRQQQVDDRLRVDAAHHLHHQGRGLHGDRSRPTLATGSGKQSGLRLSCWRLKGAQSGTAKTSLTNQLFGI